MQHEPGQDLPVSPPSPKRVSPRNGRAIILDKAFSNLAFSQQEGDIDASDSAELIPSPPSSVGEGGRNSPQPYHPSARAPRMSESAYTNSRFVVDSPRGGIGRRGRGASHAGASDVFYSGPLPNDDFSIIEEESPIARGLRGSRCKSSPA